MLRFGRATYLWVSYKFILSVKLSNGIWGSDVPLLLEFINIVFILFCNFIEFIMLLYTFLVNSFSRYKEYNCPISLSEFSDVLPAFTWASAICNVWSICLGFNVVRLEWLESLSPRRSESLATQARSEKPVPSISIGSILL